MGIPDALHNPRSDAYVRRQEEKSFRGLLKLFNRACDATGRPRYEDVCPTLPLCAPDASAPVATRGDSAPTAETDGEGLCRPPPGLAWSPPILDAAATVSMMERRCSPATNLQAVARGVRSRSASATLQSMRKFAATRLQRWWRFARPRVRRLDLITAAVEGGTAKITTIQTGWRRWHRARQRARQREALALLDSIGSRVTDFLTTRNEQVTLAESFVLPAMRDMRTDGFGPRLADRLGKYWFSARQRLEVLNQQEPHNSPPGFSLADDLEEAVHASVWKRWRLHDRHDDMAQWEDIRSSYSQLVSGVMSTANGGRRWLMRTTGCSEAVAEAVVAQALDESVRRRGFVAPSGVR